MAATMLDMATVPVFTPDQLRAIRTRLNLTQAQAAERVGVTRETWSFWETGSRKPSLQSRMLIEVLSKRKK